MVKELMDRNIQIATAIEQQSVVIEEINKNIIHINDICVEVGSFSSKQFSSSEELADNAHEQETLLSKFTLWALTMLSFPSKANYMAGGI